MLRASGGSVVSLGGGKRRAGAAFLLRVRMAPKIVQVRCRKCRRVTYRLSSHSAAVRYDMTALQVTDEINHVTFDPDKPPQRGRAVATIELTEHPCSHAKRAKPRKS
jgi:hypothetical protein